MAIGKKGPKQAPMWVAHDDLATTPGHVFYRKLNELLTAADFDGFVERVCAEYYAETSGRYSIPPGVSDRSPVWCRA